MSDKTLKSIGGALVGLACAAAVGLAVYQFVPGVSSWINTGGSIGQGTSQATSVSSADGTLGVKFPEGQVLKAAAGSTLSFVGTLAPADVTNKDIVWSVSDTAKLTLSSASSKSGAAVSVTLVADYASYVTLRAEWAGSSSVYAVAKIWVSNGVSRMVGLRAVGLKGGVETVLFGWSGSLPCTTYKDADAGNAKSVVGGLADNYTYSSYSGSTYASVGLYKYSGSVYVPCNKDVIILDATSDSYSYSGTWCLNDYDAFYIDFSCQPEKSRLPHFADAAGATTTAWASLGGGMSVMAMPGTADLWFGYCILRIAYVAGSHTFDFDSLFGYSGVGSFNLAMQSQNYVPATSLTGISDKVF